MSEPRVIEFVAGSPLRKTYRAVGAELSELTVYRIGSLGHPVPVGILHHTDDPDASDWTITDDYPITYAEREQVRVAALLAWELKFGCDDHTAEVEGAHAGPGHDHFEGNHVHDR